MFVHYFTYVPLHLGVVEHRLDDLRDALEDWAGVAYREGEELRAKVGPSVGGYAKEVRLVIGVAEIHRTGLVYPISWTAVGAQALFPKLTGELVLSHVGPEQTKLLLEATYQPPMGPLGRVVDRVLLGRFAESTVKNWVDQLAEALISEGSVT
ncbi:MAG: hypothetical protein IH918_10485 [Acidobacteria bacterium]|nr:hypothetical protein [Acidobacteriota bacterium]